VFGFSFLFQEGGGANRDQGGGYVPQDEPALGQLLLHLPRGWGSIGLACLETGFATALLGARKKSSDIKGSFGVITWFDFQLIV